MRAGVPHVVAVRREAQLQDVAACEFATAFYYALFNGRTVKQAFEIGQQAVANCPKILRAGTEADKFLLLPEDGEHGVALCREMPDGPLVDVSPTPSAHNLPAFFPLEYIGRHADIQQLVMAATGQQKRLLSLVGPAGAPLAPPPPPSSFLATPPPAALSPPAYPPRAPHHQAWARRRSPSPPPTTCTSAPASVAASSSSLSPAPRPPPSSPPPSSPP